MADKLAPKSQSRLVGLLKTLASLGCLIALWQWAALSLGPFVLPTPAAVGGAMLAMLSGPWWTEAAFTFVQALKGLGIALLVGAGSGMLAYRFRALYSLLRPWMTVLLGTPAVIWVVIGFFWFGTLAQYVTLLTVVMSVTPVLFGAAVMMMQAVPQPLVEMSRVYRFSAWRRFRYVYLPPMMQAFLPTLSVAAGMSVKVTVMAELLASNHGLGALMAVSRETLDMADFMAYVILSVVMILFLEFGVLNTLRRWLLPRTAL